MTLFYAAAHALIHRDGLFLVTQRSSANDYMPLKWDLPGGTADVGETLQQCLEREVYEETRLAVTIDRVVHVYTNLATLPDRQTFQTVFLCHYLSGDIRLNPLEHDQFAWVPKKDMRELDAMAFFADFLRSNAFTQIPCGHLNASICLMTVLP